jgi:hypothetical protein
MVYELPPGCFHSNLVIALKESVNFISEFSTRVQAGDIARTWRCFFFSGVAMPNSEEDESDDDETTSESESGSKTKAELKKEAAAAKKAGAQAKKEAAAAKKAAAKSQKEKAKADKKAGNDKAKKAKLQRQSVIAAAGADHKGELERCGKKGKWVK